MEFTEYKKVASLEEAWALNQKNTSVILGGTMWLRMTGTKKKTAIDLSLLGLDAIEETPEDFRIGCMTTLRTFELCEPLRKYTFGASTETVRHIVGVQFRNMATIGGSVFGRYGFSDLLTFFMAVGASVEFYKAGILPIEEFADCNLKERNLDKDLLVRVIIPKKENVTTYYQSVRNTETDFPVLTFAAMSHRQDDNAIWYRVAVGARPGKAVLLSLSRKEATTSELFSSYIESKISTGSNLRGSSAYRSHLVKVLAARAYRALDNMQKEED